MKTEYCHIVDIFHEFITQNCEFISLATLCYSSQMYFLTNKGYRINLFGRYTESPISIRFIARYRKERKEKEEKRK